MLSSSESWASKCATVTAEKSRSFLAFCGWLEKQDLLHNSYLNLCSFGTTSQGPFLSSFLPQSLLIGGYIAEIPQVVAGVG